MLAYQSLINVNPDAFIETVKSVSYQLNIDPNWLMIVMKIESDFRRKIVNPTSKAVGLIQFMPDTVAGLRGRPKPSRIIDREARKRAIDEGVLFVQNMTGVEQLNRLVYPYLRPYRQKMDSLYDVYLAVFMPTAIGKPDNYVLGDANTTGFKQKVYLWNKNIDLRYGDADGLLEVADIKAWVDRFVPKGYSTT